MSSTGEKRWYDKGGWLLLWTFLFFPVALYGLYQTEEFSRRQKQVFLTVAVVLIGIGALTDDSEDSATTTVEDQDAKVEPPPPAAERGSESEAKDEEGPAPPVNVKLASIQKGYEVDEDDQLARRFDVLLDNLTQTFPEADRQGVANVTVKMQNMLEKRGISPPSLRTFMEEMNGMFVQKNPGARYHEYASAYVLARSQQSMSHQEAVDGLQNISRWLEDLPE